MSSIHPTRHCGWLNEHCAGSSNIMDQKRRDVKNRSSINYCVNKWLSILLFLLGIRRHLIIIRKFCGWEMILLCFASLRYSFTIPRITSSQFTSPTIFTRPRFRGPHFTESCPFTIPRFTSSPFSQSAFYKISICFSTLFTGRRQSPWFTSPWFTFHDKNLRQNVAW